MATKVKGAILVLFRGYRRTGGSCFLSFIFGIPPWKDHSVSLSFVFYFPALIAQWASSRRFWTTARTIQTTYDTTLQRFPA
jgi:hypothetical protein